MSIWGMGEEGGDRERERWYEPEGTLGVGGVLECAEDLLEGHLILGLLVRRLPHNTVGLHGNRLVH